MRKATVHCQANKDLEGLLQKVYGPHKKCDFFPGALGYFGGIVEATDASSSSGGTLGTAKPFGGMNGVPGGTLLDATATLYRLVVPLHSWLIIGQPVKSKPRIKLGL